MRFDKREILLYLNFIYINNMTILDLYEKNLLEDFFEKDRPYFSNLADKLYEKIFDSKNLEAFEKYYEKIQRLGINYVTILDEDYPENLSQPSFIIREGLIRRMIVSL